MEALTKLIPTQVIHATSMALIHSIWILLLFGLVLYLIRSLLSPQQHQLRYLSAIGALFGGFCSVIATFLYYLSIPLSGNAYAEAPISDPAILMDVTAVQLTDQEQFGIMDTLLRNEHLITFLWLAGVVVLTMRLMISMMATQQLKQSAINSDQPYLNSMLKSLSEKMKVSANVQLKLSNKICGPMMLGCIKPTILLPIMLITQLNEEELKAVIAHELAHIQRHDYLINFFQNVAETILYFHPVVWWIRNITEQEREICCDLMALKATNDKHTYAAVLIKMQEWKLKEASNLAMTFSGNKNQFKNRILSIFQQPTTGRTSTEKAIVVLGIMIMGFGFAGFNYVMPPQQDELTAIEECQEDEEILESSLEGICIKISDSKINNNEITAIAQVQKCSKKQKCCKPDLSEEDETKLGCCNSNKQQCIRIVDDKEVEILFNFSEFSSVQLDNSSTQLILSQSDDETSSIEQLDIIVQEHISSDQGGRRLFYINHESEEKDTQNPEVIVHSLDEQKCADSNLYREYRKIKTGCHSLSAVFTWELVEDGLIEKDDSFIFELSGRALLLNGKKQSKSIWKKYKSIYEKRVGGIMNEASQIVVQNNSAQTKAYF